MIEVIPNAPYIMRAEGTGNNTMWQQREEEDAETNKKGGKREFEQREHTQEQLDKRTKKSYAEHEKLYGGKSK